MIKVIIIYISAETIPDRRRADLAASVGPSIAPSTGLYSCERRHAG